jgi:hypothetical protein
MDDFGNMRFNNLKKRALTKISELQKLIEQDVILDLVPTTVCSDGFASRSTVENFVFFAHLKYTEELISILTTQVGIVLQGMIIDNMVIGGPAFDSGLMR